MVIIEKKDNGNYRVSSTEDKSILWISAGVIQSEYILKIEPQLDEFKEVE